MDLDHACVLTSSLFWHGVLCKYFRFSISHECEYCHDSMLNMWLDAYVLNCFECLWVKAGLFELEKLVEIRILAYLRVANSKVFFKTNGYAMLISKLGNLVYTCLLCA